VDIRKLTRDDQSETERLKQIVHMDDWMVSRRFDFIRNYIRNTNGNSDILKDFSGLALLFGRQKVIPEYTVLYCINRRPLYEAIVKFQTD
jgi:hypothetical protein